MKLLLGGAEKISDGSSIEREPQAIRRITAGTCLALCAVPHTAATIRLPSMPTLIDGRPLALAATTALSTVLDVVSVATWALLLSLVTRRSKGSLRRDLFGIVLAVAAFHAS